MHNANYDLRVHRPAIYQIHDCEGVRWEGIRMPTALEVQRVQADCWLYALPLDVTLTRDGQRLAVIHG